MGYEQAPEDYESPLTAPPKKSNKWTYIGIFVGAVVGAVVAALITASVKKCAAPPPPPTCPVTGVAEPTTLTWGSTTGEITQSITPRTGMTPYTNFFAAPGSGGISIESDFDSGNIVVLSAHNPSDVTLAIVPDPFSEKDNKTFLARFLYKVNSAKGVPLKMSIVNAGDVNVASNDDETRWGTYATNFSVRASYDRENWFYVDTSYDVATGTITVSHTPTSNTVYYGYYMPFPLHRLDTSIARWGAAPHASVSVIGESLLGQPIYLVIVGDGSCEGKAHWWVTSGQHPSEVQGNYFVEGLVDAAIASFENETYSAFWETACLYAVPHMNPDGTFLGHHRTNALGYNLNRVWDDTSNDTSPEVLYTEEAMIAHGVDIYLDAHADEDNLGHFIFFAEGVCAWNETFAAVKDELDNNLKLMNPEYDGIVPAGMDGAYEPDPHCEAPLKFSDNWTGDQFSVVAGTLEMPFKDIGGFEDVENGGFTPARAFLFGTQAFDAFVLTNPAVLVQRGLV